jgi:hypothetical protein
MLADTTEIELVVACPIDGRDPPTDTAMAPARTEVAERPMAAARGIVIGVLIAIPIWIVLALTICMLR